MVEPSSGLQRPEGSKVPGKSFKEKSDRSDWPFSVIILTMAWNINESVGGHRE